MKLYNERTYFLNKNNEVVDVHKYYSDFSPFEDTNIGFAWGENSREARETMHEQIEDKAFEAVKDKIAQFLESKYDIKVDLDDTHEYAVEVYNKETGELENGYPYNMEVEDVIYDMMKWEITDSNCFFNLAEMLEYCENNNIDISDVVLYEEIHSSVDRYSFAVIYLTEEFFQDWYGIDDVSEIPMSEKQELFKDYVKLGKDYLDGEEYAYTTYSLNGEELDSVCGFYGDDTKLNGIEENTGEFIECLGAYDSIEECFEANQEKLGIFIEPLPSLMDRISSAEEISIKNNEPAVDKDEFLYSMYKDYGKVPDLVKQYVPELEDYSKIDKELLAIKIESNVDRNQCKEDILKDINKKNKDSIEL